MKYMIMMYGSQRDYDALGGTAGPDTPAWSPADMAAMGAFMEEFGARLADSGELVDTRALGAPVHTRRVRVRDGVPVVTDGPYPEAEEVLAGYWIVDCAGIDRAVEIAAGLSRCPGPAGVGRNAVVDVRPVLDSRDDLDL